MKPQRPVHLINVNFPQISAKKHIYNKFDYEVSDALYDNYDENGVPIVYNFLYKYIKNLPKTKIITTLSPDPAITSATVTANAEKYMTIDCSNNSNIPKYSSNLKIIYFTATPHFEKNIDEITVKSFSNSIISNAICDTNFTYTKHELALSENQFIIVGINTEILGENDKNELNNKNIVYFTLDMIKKKKMATIIKTINDLIMEDPVHIVFDMSVMCSDVAPCVTRFLSDDIKQKSPKVNGITITELEEALSSIDKTNVVGLDITSFDLRIKDTEKAYRLTCEVAKIALKHVLNITERKINVFNEHSKFLIWRPVDQCSHDDIGWFILRNVSLDLREKILADFVENKIITFSITTDENTEEDVFISSTCMMDQENKSYYTAESIYDCALFPEEKLNMMFELINTNENALLVDKQ